MPPLNEYIFTCLSDASTTIVITTYGDERNALNRLAFHVRDPKNWKL